MSQLHFPDGVVPSEFINSFNNSVDKLAQQNEKIQLIAKSVSDSAPIETQGIANELLTNVDVLSKECDDILGEFDKIFRAIDQAEASGNIGKLGANSIKKQLNNCRNEWQSKINIEMNIIIEVNKLLNLGVSQNARIQCASEIRAVLLNANEAIPHIEVAARIINPLMTTISNNPLVSFRRSIDKVDEAFRGLKWINKNLPALLTILKASKPNDTNVMKDIDKVLEKMKIHYETIKSSCDDIEKFINKAVQTNKIASDEADLMKECLHNWMNSWEPQLQKEINQLNNVSKDIREFEYEEDVWPGYTANWSEDLEASRIDLSDINFLIYSIPLPE